MTILAIFFRGMRTVKILITMKWRKTQSKFYCIFVMTVFSFVHYIESSLCNFQTTCTQIHVFDHGYVAKSWLSTERDLSTSSCQGNFEGAIEEKASLTNRKSPLVTRKCWKDCCHVSHVNIQIISYWCIILMLNRTDSNKDLQEIGAANYAVLERIRVNRREDHLKVSQCNKQSFNWQSVRRWIRKFCRISSR